MSLGSSHRGFEVKRRGLYHSTTAMLLKSHLPNEVARNARFGVPVAIDYLWRYHRAESASKALTTLHGENSLEFHAQFTGLLR